MQTKRIPYTFIRGGYYYFSRRVPSDLKDHYSCSRIVTALRTKSATKAKTRASVASAKLDEYWSHLRMSDPAILGKHLLKERMASLSSLRDERHVLDCPSLSDALNLYVTNKGAGRGKLFHANAARNFTYLAEACGDKPLSEYTRADALNFRSALVNRNLAGSSVTRILNTIRSIFNFAISEYALEIKNPFVGLYHDRQAGVREREPIPIEAISVIQGECMRLNDEMRWLVALISDTGMRLAEGAGLLKEDIHLDGEVPCIVIRPHVWRSLKTGSSERAVPLVGASLWAAKQIVSAPNASKFAFPRYNKTNETNANSASAGLNKWIKAHVPYGCSMHSFRHSLRDRLRAVECPTEIADQIGGWQSAGVGTGYGRGFPIEVIHSWLKKLEL